ncbi:MAG TPA: hypothetical protein VMV79_00380 [Alphaproteobacteria bacterium]|nr:hypothetical protein [Alphaproteobacteria bacterium]
MREQQIAVRLPADAGIAIGPILFIIAILGILAAAIAAGSGSFTASTTNEGFDVKASALVQAGETLHEGMDRITLEGGIGVNNVVTNVTATNGTLDLFSPTGGGIAAPSVALANNPASDVWEFPTATVFPGVGTANGVTMALLNVPEGVCDAVNVKANGMTVSTNYNAADLGDPTNTATLTIANLPAAFDGKMLGCLANSNAAGGYWFYEIVAIQ